MHDDPSVWALATLVGDLLKLLALKKHYGLAGWHSKLILCLWHWRQIWTPAQVPGAPFLVQLPADGLGKQQRIQL